MNYYLKAKDLFLNGVWYDSPNRDEQLDKLEAYVYEKHFQSKIGSHTEEYAKEYATYMSQCDRRDALGHLRSWYEGNYL